MSKCACRQLEIGQEVRLVATKLPPLSPARELGAWARKRAYVVARSYNPALTPTMDRHFCEILVSPNPDLTEHHNYWIDATLFQALYANGNEVCAVDVAKLLGDL